MKQTRRDFLRAGGSVLLFTCAGFGGGASGCASTGIATENRHYAGDPSMAKSALVIYGTRAGSTAEVADFVGKTLSESGWSVDVKDVKTVQEVEGYQAVIIGSGIRAGRVYSEVKDFVKNHQTGLQKMPVAYFVVCMAMRNDTPEKRIAADAYLDPLREEVKPVDVGLFAGKMDPDRLGTLDKLMQKIRNMPVGDFRDWKSIEDWSRALAPKLQQ